VVDYLAIFCDKVSDRRYEKYLYSLKVLISCMQSEKCCWLKDNVDDSLQLVAYKHNTIDINMNINSRRVQTHATVVNQMYPRNRLYQVHTESHLQQQCVIYLKIRMTKMFLFTIYRYNILLTAVTVDRIKYMTSLHVPGPISYSRIYPQC